MTNTSPTSRSSRDFEAPEDDQKVVGVDLEAGDVDQETTYVDQGVDDIDREARMNVEIELEIIY